VLQQLSRTPVLLLLQPLLMLLLLLLLLELDCASVHRRPFCPLAVAHVYKQECVAVVVVE
jgi:hypothetical protein